jgi:hypothetical protein
MWLATRNLHPAELAEATGHLFEMLPQALATAD